MFPFDDVITDIVVAGGSFSEALAGIKQSTTVCGCRVQLWLERFDMNRILANMDSKMSRSQFYLGWNHFVLTFLLLFYGNGIWRSKGWISPHKNCYSASWCISEVCISISVFNSPHPIAAYMRQGIESALVQIIACRLFGTKPFSKPMLCYS